MKFIPGLLAVAMVAGSACAAPYAHAETEYYMHNGSLMKMVWDDAVGEYFKMFYVKPRRGLAVRQGAFFMGGGYPAGGEVYAYPRTFKRGCEPAEYRVTGRFDETGNLLLGGKAPVRHGCTVIGYTSTKNSWLVFTKKH